MKFMGKLTRMSGNAFLGTNVDLKKVSVFSRTAVPTYLGSVNYVQICAASSSDVNAPVPVQYRIVFCVLRGSDILPPNCGELAHHLKIMNRIVVP